jgi:hypothetical protein
MAFTSPLLWQSIPFGQPEGMLDFFGLHDQVHAALAKHVGTVSIVRLDNLPEMMDVHDDQHKAINQALGLSPPTDFSLYDIKQRQGWVLFAAAHALEHARLRAATRI